MFDQVAVGVAGVQPGSIRPRGRAIQQLAAYGGWLGDDSRDGTDVDGDCMGARFGRCVFDEQGWPRHRQSHWAILESALVDLVQSLLHARCAKMTRHVRHAHPLNELLHCGACGTRMLLDFATNPRGTTYAYFVCSGRATKKTNCTRRAVPVAVAERLVADSYARVTVSDSTYQRLAADVDAAFDKRSAGQDQHLADLAANRARLEAESDKLLAAHFADALDLPTLKRHHDRIHTGLADVNRRLAEHSEHWTGGRAFLHDSLLLLTDLHRACAHSGDADRRLANQAFCTRLDITDDEQLRPRLAEPFATVFREAHDSGDEARKPNGNTQHLLMSRVPERHSGWS